MSAPTVTRRSSDPEWFRHPDRVCANADHELFFPIGTGPNAFAAGKALCKPCPVKQECLTWAMDHDEAFGVWGGTSPTDRRAMIYRWRNGWRP